MPFSSGTFSLVAGNPVVTGTTISSAVNNNTNNDIATGLSTCLLKDGTQTATAAIPFVTGVTTTSTTFAVFNTTATTINAFGAASVALNMGNASGTNTILGATTFSQALTTSGALTGASAAGAMVATQSDQETATSTTTVVSPGRQQFHPSAAKVWVSCGVAGNIFASYNMSSVTDDGAGLARVIWATDFSSTSYAAIPALTNDATSAATTLVASITEGSKTVTQCQVQSTRVTDGAHIDPNEGYNFVAYGDQ